MKEFKSRIGDAVANAIAADEFEKSASSTPATLPQTQGGFGVAMIPAAIVGALTGSAIAKRKSYESRPIHGIAPAKPTVTSGSYYKQVQNLERDIDILFTPFNVVISVGAGQSKVTIDTISTEEMDDAMHRAFQSRDKLYFKHLVMNKIKSEIQLAEKLFARRLIDKRIEIENQLGKNVEKKASTFDHFLGDLAEIKEVFEKNAESQLGEIFVKCSDGLEVSIPTDLSGIRPFSKYAGVISGVSNFFGFNAPSVDMKILQKKMDTPGYLRSKVEVGMLPDRVMFIVDGVVLDQLPVLEMNEEGYERFEADDKTFFKNLFRDQFRGGLIQKTAAEIETSIWKSTTTAPATYFRLLTAKLGDDWVSYDPETLVKEIEEDFDIKDGIDDLPLNKVLCIQLINKSLEPFINSLVFEKVVRAFNNMPIDFTEHEKTFKLGELIYAIRTMQALTPHDDIYDNFSLPVIDYIADVLFENDYVAIKSFSITGTESEKVFYSDINTGLLKRWSRINGNINKIHSEIMDAVDHLNNMTRGSNSVRERLEQTAILLETIDSYLSENGLSKDESSMVKNSLEKIVAAELYAIHIKK